MAARSKTAPAPKQGETPTRKRKAHKKSRLGCRNCKLRRVKCNESRPMCGQCLEFGVICNYDPTIPDLQPQTAASDVVQLPSQVERSPLSTTEPIIDMMNAYFQQDKLLSKTTSMPGLLRFDHSELAGLNRFQTRTVLTIAVKQVARVFHNQVTHLACQHRFLMHLVQAVTASHDRYLSGTATAKPSTREAYHMNQALVAYQTLLSRPIHIDDRDALLTASSLLGVVTFFNLEAETVEDVWPLVDCDMSWLTISDGKKTVWRLAVPLKEDSIWRNVSRIFDTITAVEETPEHKHTLFDHLCAEEPLTQSPSMRSLCSTARALNPLLDLECNESTWTLYLGFLCHVDPPFKILMEKRDPWALLILLYWFAKMCRTVWWVASRSILQGQAICIYLERYHSHDSTIQSGLIWPRAELKAAELEGWGGVSSVTSSPRSSNSWMFSPGFRD